MGEKRSSDILALSSPPSRKRSRPHKDATSTPSAPAVPPRNSFKGLPLELQDQIYRFCLDATIEEPEHPYSPYPDNHTRFKGYTSLRLVDRDISAEVKRLFLMEGYANGITLYFDDAPSLYDAYIRCRRTGMLERFHFQIRARNDTGFDDDHEGDLLRSDTEALIDMQEGFEYTWYDWPGLYGDRLQPQSTRHFFTPPEVMEHFTFKDGEHSQCASKEECRPYQEVIFPQLPCGLYFRSCYWQSRFAGTRPPFQKMNVGCVTMGGRLGDVSFWRYNVQTGRDSLIRYLVFRAPPWFKNKYVGLYPASVEDLTDYVHGVDTHRWPAVKDEPGLPLRLSNAIAERHQREQLAERVRVMRAIGPVGVSGQQCQGGARACTSAIVA